MKWKMMDNKPSPNHDLKVMDNNSTKRGVVIDHGVGGGPLCLHL